MPELRVRAGVLTGNAAVELGAEGEGMVLGDTVNTASRLQSIAEPGTVLVDDVTRRASEAAIAYEDAGEHEVKGREQPVHAWTALRVVAGAGGARRERRTRGAVRRPRARAAARSSSRSRRAPSERRARLVTVVGEAGLGKSRLLWEFFKYMDGIEEWSLLASGPLPVLRRGRRLLGAGRDGPRAGRDRSRRRIRRSAREKLRATVEQFVTDERERRLVEPRLAHLLGLEQRTGADRADLFSGWRLFFERMADDAAGDPRVRGSPVGRQRAAGLHRLPARVVGRATRSSCSRSAARSCCAARPGVGRRRSRWRRCATARCRAARRVSCPDCPRAAQRDPSSAPRACRCTRSRRSGCCSIAGCSHRRAPATW